jgi:hypothetical protein
MTITVDQPSFFINLKNPTEVAYQVEENAKDWRGMIVQSWMPECPAPTADQILYRYTQSRGCFHTIDAPGPTASKHPPRKSEPATPAKKAKKD